MHPLRYMLHEAQEWIYCGRQVSGLEDLSCSSWWYTLPREENPADIPSRYLGASALINTALWLDGPDWLHQKDEPREGDTDRIEILVPEDCQPEMKRKEAAHSLQSSSSSSPVPHHSIGDQVCAMPLLQGRQTCQSCQGLASSMCEIHHKCHIN